MKIERDKTRPGVIIVAALTSLLVACATQEQDNEGAANTELGAVDHAAPSDPQTMLDLGVAPPAPDGAASRPAGLDKGDTSILVASPTISPNASVQFVSPGASYSCARGNLCTGVWDPNAGRWKVFKLFSCATYRLSQWNGAGFYLDNQTGNPRSCFYGQSGNELFCFFPDGLQHNYNWDPVWFIKNC